MLFWLKNDVGKKYSYASKDLSLAGYTRSICPNCGREVVSPTYIGNAPHLILEGGRKFPDFLQFCGAGNRLTIVSENALNIFERESVSGYDEYLNCQIEVASTFKDVNNVPNYYSLNVSGSVDLDLQAMHLRRKKVCSSCGQFEWSRTRIGVYIVDEKTWDSSDICFLKSMPGIKLCSSKFVEIVNSNNLAGFSFPPISLPPTFVK